MFQTDVRQLEPMLLSAPSRRVDKDPDLVDAVQMTALTLRGSRISIQCLVYSGTHHRILEFSAVIPVKRNPAGKFLIRPQSDSPFAPIAPFLIGSEADQFHLEFSGEIVCPVLDLKSDCGISPGEEPLSGGIFQQNSGPFRTVRRNVKPQRSIFDLITAGSHFPDSGLHSGKVEEKPGVLFRSVENGKHTQKKSRKECFVHEHTLISCG